MAESNTTKYPAAACQMCGGWTSYGGMSQHANGPEGCSCPRTRTNKGAGK